MPQDSDSEEPGFVYNPVIRLTKPQQRILEALADGGVLNMLFYSTQKMLVWHDVTEYVSSRTVTILVQRDFITSTFFSYEITQLGRDALESRKHYAKAVHDV